TERLRDHLRRPALHRPPVIQINLSYTVGWTHPIGVMIGALLVSPVLLVAGSPLRRRCVRRLYRDGARSPVDRARVRGIRAVG
ncbi:hypothetical protein ACFVSN_18955, partial [Kitasatospora sp. NPDC057904]